MEPFNSEDRFPTPIVEQFDTRDYGFKDRYSPEQRLLVHIYLGLNNKLFFFSKRLISSHRPNNNYLSFLQNFNKN